MYVSCLPHGLLLHEIKYKQNFRLINDEFTIYIISQVDIDGKLEDPESIAWGLELVETVTKKWGNQNNLRGHVSSFEGIGYEADKSIERDLKKFSIGYVFVFVFAVWVLFQNNSVVCKSHLAPISILSIVMAVFTAFGIAVAVGVELNFVVKGLPFILLGLGIDDTFVIMGAYRSTSMDLSVEDRMAETMARAVSTPDFYTQYVHLSVACVLRIISLCASRRTVVCAWFIGFMQAE